MRDRDRRDLAVAEVKFSQKTPSLANKNGGDLGADPRPDSRTSSNLPRLSLEVDRGNE